MNQRQIECFINVVETKSFSEAAKRLFTTQPNVSHHITELEKELNVKLMNRNKSNIILTRAGTQFYQKALIIQNTFNEISQAMIKYQKNDDIIIGFPSLLVTYNTDAYLDIMNTLHKEIHNVVFKSVIIDGEDKTYALLENMADIVICHLPKSTSKEIYYQEVFNSRILVAMSRDNLLYRKEKINLDDLQSQSIYVVENDSSFTPLVKKILTKKYQTIQVGIPELSLPHLLTGNGVLIAPSKYLNYTNIVYKEIVGIPDYPVFVCCLKDRQEQLQSMMQIISDIHHKYEQIFIEK